MSTILVIDDDKQMRKYLEYVLELDGHRVRLASDGSEGLRSYRSDPADLVLCDIFMEGKEGLETIRQLVQEFPQTKIIAMSGGSTTVPGDFLYQAVRFGAAATLVKPLERTTFLQTVKTLLNDQCNG